MMINPVLRRELRTKLRTWKAPLLIVLYLVTISGVGGLFIFAQEYNSFLNTFNPENALALYGLIAGFQLGLVVLIAPALTAGSISGERERQTLDLLLVTRMSSFSIITGKLLASLSQILLLVVASMPVFGLVLFYGGISIANILSLFLFYIITAFMLGSIGIFCSTFFKRTTISTVVVYLIMLFLSLGTLVIFLFSQEFYHMITSNSLEYKHAVWIIGYNPFVGFLSIIDDQLGSGIIAEIFYYGPQITGIWRDIKLWHINIGLDVILSILLLGISMWKIKPTRGRQ